MKSTPSCLRSCTALRASLRISNPDAIRKVLRCVVNNGSGCHDFRAQQYAGVDPLPKEQNEGGVSAHIAGTHNALGYEQVQAFRSGTLVVAMNIPKTWDKKLARPFRRVVPRGIEIL